MSSNILLATDVYKLGHLEQYVDGCTNVYSYLMARSNKNYERSVFFGLQYYLKEYLSRPITKEMADDFLIKRKQILGSNSEDVINKIYALAKLGYFPLKIKAVPEGTVIENRNVLMTITNTLPEFYWVVGFVESLLLKVWYSTTVATTSFHYRQTVEKYFNETVDADQNFLKPFQVHDFGYRGDSSEESAGISGMSHALSFIGSDTVVTLPFANKYYNGESENKPIILSVPASEHSTMCSFGVDNELGAYRHMLKTYPTGIVSIVSDTYDIWRVLTDYAEILKEDILKRDGKVVFRPDSGNPEYIICGDPTAIPNSNAWKGAIRLLDEKFGSTVNKKGFKVLNPKVGLIYGDGMYLARYMKTLERLKEMGYASSNLVIGVGGILRFHSRDTLGFAIKATNVIVNGKSMAIKKDPITDPGKKSHTGLLMLDKELDGSWVTKDNVSIDDEEKGYLKIVFDNGKLLCDESIHTLRQRLEKQIK
ncbi:MAG: nicotinate phosphoribosyltransferase [Edafosvirus sp.]|uniref:Nicotinamide phosphoribosyltransferase n=1 Tax=Edafosvirus sp. TaxID=2487765 RepID=A0A3G4ZVD5_9VIRU|nr:MAG: nicotinate phosphoribosyltransferase [Edafosvirus sp.]